MSARILLIEDEPAIVTLLRASLGHEGYSLSCALDAGAGWAALSAVLPDVILLDWMLPDMAGIALLQKIRANARTRSVPVIMLTARGAEEDKVAGLSGGADDYITKPFSLKELAARIEAVLRRRAPESAQDIIVWEGLSLDPGTRRVIANGQPLSLGPIEFRLLQFLMAHPERVHSRPYLLDQVWGDHVFVDERTVDVHIRRVRSALEPSGLDKFIQTVRGSGYRFSVQCAET